MYELVRRTTFLQRLNTTSYNFVQGTTYYELRRLFKKYDFILYEGRLKNDLVRLSTKF